MMRFAAVILSLGAVLLAGCVVQAPDDRTPTQRITGSGSATTTQSSGAPDPGSFRTLEHSNLGSAGAGDDAKRRTILSASEWQDFWEDYSSNQQPRPAAPTVDFGKEFVIVVSQGRKTSTGHNVTIDSIEWASSTSNRLEVAITETTPGPSCVTGAAETHPIHIIAVPRRGAAAPEATFDREAKTHVCSTRSW